MGTFLTVVTVSLRCAAPTNTVIDRQCGLGGTRDEEIQASVEILGRAHDVGVHTAGHFRV